MFNATHIARIRDELRAEMDNGRLDAIAGRARVSAAALYDWMHDASKCPSYGELADLHEALASKVTSERDTTYNGFDCMFFKKQAE